MNQFEIQILVVHIVMMNILDGEVESGLVAFVDQGGQDISASAEQLAAERGAILLQVDVPQNATLYDQGLKEQLSHGFTTPERSGCDSPLQ